MTSGGKPQERGFHRVLLATSFADGLFGSCNFSRAARNFVADRRALEAAAFKTEPDDTGQD
jgi:hypothetical protein